MKLKEGNTLSYAPLKSRVFIENENPSTGNITIDNLNINTANGQQYYDVMVGGVEYLEDDVVIDFDDFNFRVDLKEENKIPVTDLRVKSMLKNWDSSKKIYRFI